MFKYLEKIFGIEGLNVDDIRKRTFLSFCIIICIPFISLFAIDDLRNARLYEGFFILIVLLVFLLNLFALKYIKRIERMYRFSASLVFSLLCYELAIGGGEGHAFLWFYFFPLAAFYLLGKKEGVAWVSMSLLISASLNRGQVRFWLFNLSHYLTGCADCDTRLASFRVFNHAPNGAVIIELGLPPLPLQYLPIAARCSIRQGLRSPSKPGPLRKPVVFY